MTKDNQNKTKQKQQTKKNKVKKNKNNKARTRSAPVAKSRQRTTGKPHMKSSGTSITITHTELITTITRINKDFSYDKYYVNPGNSTTFPWLSRLAPNYESYKFHKLKFEFSTSAPTNLGGTVCMAADYDASDPAPDSKAVMMAYSGAKRSAPWDDLSMMCTGVRNYNNTHFVETRTSRDGFDQADFRSTDICSFIIATEGLTVTEPTDIGELYVTYSVTLKTPQLGAPVATATQTKKKSEIKVNLKGKVRDSGTGSVQVPKGWLRWMNEGFTAQPVTQTLTDLTDVLAGAYGNSNTNIDLNALYAFLLGATGWAATLTYAGRYRGLKFNGGSDSNRRLSTYEVIDWNSLSDTHKALVPNLVKMYSDGDDDGVPVLGLDLNAIAHDLFPEEGLSFEYLVDGTPISASEHAHQKPPTLVSTPFVTCVDESSEFNGEPVPLVSLNHIDYAFHASLLGIPSPDGHQNYYRFSITNFAGVSGATMNYKVGAVLSPGPDSTIIHGSQVAPLMNGNMGYRMTPARSSSKLYIGDWPVPQSKVPGQNLQTGNSYLASVGKSFITIRATRLDNQTMYKYADKFDSSVEVLVELPVVCEFNDITRVASSTTFLETMDPPLEKVTDILPHYQYSDWYRDVLDSVIARNRKP